MIQKLVITEGVPRYITEPDKLRQLSDEYKELFNSDLKSDFEMIRKAAHEFMHT